MFRRSKELQDIIDNIKRMYMNGYNKKEIKESMCIILKCDSISDGFLKSARKDLKKEYPTATFSGGRMRMN